MLYERHQQPLLSRRLFLVRLWNHFLVGLGVIGLSLLIGVVGYRVFAHFAWIDSFLNASMLLGGMGPVGDIQTMSGKIFAALYALYAGLVLIVVSSIMLAPVFHRILHQLHLGDDEHHDR